MDWIDITAAVLAIATVAGALALWGLLRRFASIQAAAGDGNLKRVKQYLMHGADIDGQDEHGCTALHWAVQEGEFETALHLISAGASVDIADEAGRTPASILENVSPEYRIGDPERWRQLYGLLVEE